METAILIDGESLFSMRRTLGIGNIHFRNLYKILTSEIGTLREVTRTPLITFAPSRSGLEKMLQRARFAPKFISPEESADDQFIIHEIQNLDAAEVGELVLVTNDSDFIECVQAKKDLGIAIYWVYCKGKGSDEEEYSSVSPDLFQYDFNFYDLGRFRERIMLSPYSQREDETEIVRIIDITIELPSDPAGHNTIQTIFSIFGQLTAQNGVEGDIQSAENIITISFPVLRGEMRNIQAVLSAFGHVCMGKNVKGRASVKKPQLFIFS